MKHRSQSRSLVKSFYRGLYGGLGAAGIGLAMAGCSRGPSAVGIPSYDPEGAAQQALEMYDTDHDGFVSGSELEKAPGLRAAIKTLDVDQDGKISEDEIAKRVATWGQAGFGLMTVTCEATLDGESLSEALITFVPEKFLDGVIQEASGVTSGLGATYLSIPKENRPSADTPPGIQAGLYQVRISKIVNGKETIPPQYNSETTLGQQISMDDPAIKRQSLAFRLKSK